MSLRRATLLSHPENEKVYSLGDNVAVCSETNDCDKWNERPIKGSKSQVYEEIWTVLLQSKKLKKCFP